MTGNSIGNTPKLLQSCAKPLIWHLHKYIPDSKVHMAHMGPTWVLSAPGRPHVGPMNLAIRDVLIS